MARGSVFKYVHQNRRDERGRPAVSWRFTVNVTPGPDGERRQKRFTGFPTRDAAERAMRAFQTDVDGGDYIEPATVTLAEQIESWLGGRRNIEPTTLRGYTVALGHASTHLGHRKLQKVCRADVEGLIHHMTHRPQPLSARTVRLTLGLLKRVFRDAVRDGLIRKNPAEYVEAPRGRPRETRTWTPAEMHTFAAHAAQHRLAPAWRLTLGGLRRSEVLGLRWHDLDLTAGTVTIAQARVMLNDRETYLKAPKTDRGRRTLPLDPQAIAAFTDYRLRLLEDSLAFGAAYDTSHDLVVVDEAGRPLRPEFYSDEFKRLAKASGVPIIRLHDARHTCATYLHAQGLPTAAISAWLGHASAAFTLRTYVHPTVDGMGQARDLLARALAAQIPRT